MGCDVRSTEYSYTKLSAKLSLSLDVKGVKWRITV